MNSISSSMLSQTLNLMQIARESARTTGSMQRAERLQPVVEQLQKISTSERSSIVQNTPVGELARPEFETLLKVTGSTNNQPSSVEPAENRQQLISSLTKEGFSDLDVARQLGISRQEVKVSVRMMYAKKAYGS